MLAWATIGAPIYTASLCDQFGHRFVLATLMLAWSTGVVESNSSTSLALKTAAFTAGFALWGLSFLQRQATAQGQRWLAELTVALPQN